MSLPDDPSSFLLDDDESTMSPSPPPSPPSILRIPLALRRTRDEASASGVIPGPINPLPRMIPVSIAYMLFATRMAMIESVEHRNLRISALNMELLFHSWSTNPVATYLMTNGPFPIDRIRTLYEAFGRTLSPALSSVPDEVRSDEDIATMRDTLIYEAVRTETDITAVLDALTYDIGLRFMAEAVRTAPQSEEIAVHNELLMHFRNSTQRQADSETWQRIYNDFMRAYNRPLRADTTAARTVQPRTQPTTDEPATAQNTNADDASAANDAQ
ncbi:Maltose/galactoside acetyltransferase [Penicillium coprophilum]|uniref:Maltose/galactoside acetyltransferase n=1 Tax=Penicillium coprophilum TaxID=36646 RepID=UPI0023A40E63|nr:Maltose/galactoside acetyltransferase [Penicillium coprophilum]KAJ5153590.1 Maltose/galactoside acetyltransferase [Penicillium coprophilum]